MKYLGKIQALAFCSLLLLFSCKDDQETQVTPEVKNVKLVNPVEGSKVWNTVEVKVEAEGLEGIKSVDFYAGTELIGTDTEAPFNVSWNTRNIEDGEVTVKAVVTNKLEGAFEVQSTVKVLNTLLKIRNVTDRYYDDISYVILSDSDGNLLDYKKVAMGEEITITSPEHFNGDHFILSYVQPDNQYPGLFSFMEVERGTNWDILTSPWEDAVYLNYNTRVSSPNEKDYFDVNLLNVPEGVEDMFFCTNDGTILLWKSFHSTSFRLDMHGKSTNLFVQIEGKYFFYEGFEAGKTYNLDLSKVTKPVKVGSREIPAGTNNLDWRIDGHLESGGYYDTYRMLSANVNNAALVTYPENEFKTFYSFVDAIKTREDGGDTYSVHYYKGVEFPSKVFNETEVTGHMKEDGSVVLNTNVSGAFDLIGISVDAGTNEYNWMVYGPVNTKAVKPIQLPEEVKKELPPASGTSSVSVFFFNYGFTNQYQEALSVFYRENFLESLHGMDWHCEAYWDVIKNENPDKRKKSAKRSFFYSSEQKRK